MNLESLMFCSMPCSIPGPYNGGRREPVKNLLLSLACLFTLAACQPSESAIQTAQRLAKAEGILAGISSGANMFAALQIAQRTRNKCLIVTVFPDTGERYISTELFGDN